MAVGAKAIARSIKFIYPNKGVVIIDISGHQSKQIIKLQSTHGHRNLLFSLCANNISIGLTDRILEYGAGFDNAKSSCILVNLLTSGPD
jgi:ribosome biogenesis protein Tsr3